MTFWVMIILAIAVILFCAGKGAKNGFVSEINSVVTMLCAMAVFNIVSDIMTQQGSMKIPVLLAGTLLLIVTLAAYGLFHVIFKAIHLFSRLPVIRILDNILGFFAGILEGAVALYLADSLLRYFVY